MRGLRYAETNLQVLNTHGGIPREMTVAVLKSCLACQSANSLNTRAEMKAIQSNGNWHHIEMDLIDLHAYAQHNHGYCWLLTVVDVFSKFAFAYPLTTKSPDNVVDALADLFDREGTPGILQSDNGKEFVASVIKNFLDACSIEIRHGRPRHPQSQGQIERYAVCPCLPAVRATSTLIHFIEATNAVWRASNGDRFNQTIMRIINKGNYRGPSTTAPDPCWLAELPHALRAYNTRTHEAHGMTPFSVFRGRRHVVDNAVAQDEHDPAALTLRVQEREKWLREYEDTVRVWISAWH